MNKTVRNIALILSGILILLVGIAFALPFLLENKIKQQIIAEINEQINVPVEVRGGMRLSLFRHFPKASFSFYDVRIADKLRDKEQLLHIKEFSFLCDIPSLFSKEIEFSNVLLRDGEIHFYIEDKGRNNYDILKAQTTTSDRIAIQLQKAEMKNVQLFYLDKSRRTDISVRINQSVLKGKFNEERFELNTSTDVLVYHAISGTEDFLKGKNLKAEVLLDVDKPKNKYEFKRGNIIIDGNEFNITGFFASLKEGIAVDFQLTSRGKDIREVFKIVPSSYKENFAHAEGSGEYAIAADIKGLISATRSASVNVRADFKDSELKLGKYNKLLKKVNATVSYKVDEKGKDQLIISNFNCTLNNLPFRFTLHLNNLSDPDFDFFANGVMYLSELATFVPESAAKDFKGSVRFNNFRLTGRKRDFIDVQRSSMRGSGDFELTNAALTAKGVIYENINGKLAYGTRSIEAKDFTIRFLKTDFQFTGTVDNLLSYIYNLADNKTDYHATLGINGKLATRVFDLTAMIEGFKKASEGNSTATDKPTDMRDIFNMRGHLDVEIGRFLFRKTVFENVTGNLQAAPAMIRFNRLNAQTMKGELRGNGLLHFTPTRQLNIQADVNALDLAIKEIFIQSENFGQTTLTDKNLEGNITLSATINAAWNEYITFDEKSFTALLEIQIKNGRLINFEPVRAASRFIRIEELQDIRFADLKNTLKIANRRVDIPEFELKSSALNMILSGYHYFNNDVDYRFKINLHKLLARKFNRTGRDVQYIENDPYEGVNIYLSMIGNLSNPKIKYDKTSSRKKMADDFRKEKENLRHLFKNTSKQIDENEKKREDKYFDLRQQPEFMDFDTTDY